jgi:hypothetical protein
MNIQALYILFWICEVDIITAEISIKILDTHYYQDQDQPPKTMTDIYKATPCESLFIPEIEPICEAIEREWKGRKTEAQIEWGTRYVTWLISVCEFRYRYIWKLLTMIHRDILRISRGLGDLCLM